MQYLVRHDDDCLYYNEYFITLDWGSVQLGFDFDSSSRFYVDISSKLLCFFGTKYMLKKEQLLQNSSQDINTHVYFVHTYEFTSTHMLRLTLLTNIRTALFEGNLLKRRNPGFTFIFPSFAALRATLRCTRPYVNSSVKIWEFLQSLPSERSDAPVQTTAMIVSFSSFFSFCFARQQIVTAVNQEHKHVLW